MLDPALFDDRVKLREVLEARVLLLYQRRTQQEEVWLLNHSAWRGKFTRSFFHSETFNHYIPHFRRAIEKFAVRGAQMVMPDQDFFEVFPADEVDDDQAKRASSVYAYERFLFTKKIRTYALVKQLFRTYALYGRAITKASIRVVHEDGKDRVWPTVRAVDPFQFHVWPETVTDLDEADLVVEDAIISYDRYQASVGPGDGQASPLAQSELTAVTWPSHISRRLQLSGVAEPTSSTTPGAEVADSAAPAKKESDFVQLSEIWINDGKGWRFVWLVWNLQKEPRVTRVSTARFARPAYRMSIAREVPGEQYTTSMGDDLEPLQVLENDQLNLLLEGQAMNILPPVTVDPFMAPRTGSFVFRPRAIWRATQGAVSPVFNALNDTSRIGYTALQFTSGLIDTFSGSSPLAEGQSIRNMPRAGFAVSSLLSMSLSDIRDAAISIETDLLAPALQDTFTLTVKYVPEAQVLRIPGARDFPARNLIVKDIEGNWDFNWVGALQQQNFEQKSQKLLGFVTALGKAWETITADLKAKGKQVNWTVLLKRLWREGLGERGLEDIIEDIPESTETGPAMSGAPAGPGAEGNFVDIDRLISQMSGGEGV